MSAPKLSQNQSLPLDQITWNIERVYLHDSVPELAVSKTLSKDTIPSAKMSYTDESAVLKIEYKGKTSFMPITNIKCMMVK